MDVYNACLTNEIVENTLLQSNHFPVTKNGNICVCFAIACVNRLITRELQVSNVTGAIQFRFLQEEHAGGYCSCWGISDLAVYNGTTRFTDERYIDTVYM